MLKVNDMGQAKRRGTFEERLALAVKRNKQLEEQTATNHEAVAYQKRHGTQQFATKLVMAGVLAWPPKP